MIVKKFTWLATGTLAIICLLGMQAVQATTAITFLDSSGNPAALNPASPTHANASDYSAAGLNIGQSGYLFFNFGQTADTGPLPVGDNRADALPSWIGVDYDPNSATYSFGQDAGFEAFSQGGVSSWASLTLPDGTTGNSGAIIDPKADNNSNNTIKNLPILAGAPSSFLLHIVTDNTNLDHDPVNRIRAREDISGFDAKTRNLSFNSNPDVYTFRYDGVAVGDVIKVQLNSGVGGVSPSIAGIMFDVVPEPASAMMLLLGGLGLALAGRCRR